MMIHLACLLAQCRWYMPFLLVALLNANLSYGQNQSEWDRTPYRIQLQIAIDSATKNDTRISNQLAEYIEHRVAATLSPWWKIETSLASGPLQHQLLTQTDKQSLDENSNESLLNFDKQMFLAVSRTTSGYIIRCREFDRSVRVQGPVITRTVRQNRMLLDQCFKLLCDTFAPLAKIRRLEEKPKQVMLQFKGRKLMNPAIKALFIHPQDIYLPLQVRLTRTGEVRPGGINAIPWTYLETVASESPENLSRVHSANQHPFGVRRRGRVEHIALALRHPPATTQVRFYAQHDKLQSLVGYEVFRRDPNNEQSKLIGITDSYGSIKVKSGNTNITNLFLRSGDQLLAKIPIVPGKDTLVEIPIADDIARLNAQAALTSLREQLIDLVARRNILIARTRDRIAESSFEEAKQLFAQLDELPGRAQFAQLISTAQKNSRNRSAEPRIQARIDKMFANTRKLLGRFLDTRPISDLQGELNRAISDENQS